MDIIGIGAQYKVIDTLDGRVLKELLTREESQAVISGWYAPNEAPAEELAIDYQQVAVDASQQVRHVLAMYPELASAFGHPLFEAGGAYTQDKVRTVGEIVASATLAEGRQLVDRYVQLLILLWRYGIAESVFNCTVNNGVDSTGNVILLDFGEITANKDRIARSITEKRWLQAYSYKHGLPQGLRPYYHDAMAQELTLANLEKVWQLAFGRQA